MMIGHSTALPALSQLFLRDNYNSGRMVPDQFLKL